MDITRACQIGDVDRVRELLQNGANPTENNNAPIAYASCNGHADIVKLLLQDGQVDPSVFYNAPIRNASYYGHPKIVEMLLQDRRVDPTDDDNYTIKYACLNRHIKVIELLLQDGRADPSVNDNSILRFASSFGHIKVVELLLRDGRVEPNDLIEKVATEEIREMLIRYKYRVDGNEYCRLKNQLATHCTDAKRKTPT